MNLEKDPIAEKVEQQMNELKKDGVDFTVETEHGLGGSKYNRVFEAFYRIIQNSERIKEAAKAILSETMFFEVGEEGEHFEDTATYQHLEGLVRKITMVAIRVDTVRTMQMKIMR